MPGHAARDVMRPAPAAVAPRDPLARARDLMTAFGVRELPVVDDGRLVGIVVASDLAPHLGYLELRPVAVAMTANPATVAPGAPLTAVADVLLGGRFNAVPVVSRGELAGMVNREDFVKVVLDRWAADA